MTRLLQVIERRRLRLIGGAAILLLLVSVLFFGRAIDCTRVDKHGLSNQQVPQARSQHEPRFDPTPEALAALEKSLVRRSGPQSLLPAPPADDNDSIIVRVNLTATPVRRLRLAIDGPFQVSSLQSNDPWKSYEGLSACDANATDDGIRIGTRNHRVSSLRIVANASPAIWINGRQYRGEVRLHRRGGNRLIAVNHVRLDDYLASVVDSEMPAAFPNDARRAQAVVARTYALAQQTGHPLFDLYATSRSQRYLGSKYRDERGRLLAGESADSRKTVQDTAGMICTHGGRIFCTYYSAVCGGRTTHGASVFADASPPLQCVECPWCRDAAYFRWSRRVARVDAFDQLRRFFVRRGNTLEALESFRVVQESVDRFPVQFVAADGRSRHAVSAVELRQQVFPALLPSPFFTVDSEGGDLVFRGRGHGHGVGLCQWGARGMALAGKSCREILQHYYPGSRLNLLDRRPPPDLH